MKNGIPYDSVQKVFAENREETSEWGAEMPEISVRGTKIHYLRTSSKAGESRSGILLIHGSGGNAEMWQKVIAGLEGRYECLAVDLPGHGGSEGSGSTRIDDYCAFLKDFLSVLGKKEIILGGHSMGGGIAQEFALEYPGAVRALLLIGTGGRLRVLPAALEMLRQMARGEIPPRFDPWGFAEKASKEVIAEGERQWAKTNSQVRYQDMLACDQFDVLSRLEQIRIPALILCGEEDRLTPLKYSEFLQKKIPGATMETIPGAGHMVMLEKPGELSQAILQFLAFI